MKKKEKPFKIYCDVCGDLLIKPGALLFSPPFKHKAPYEVDKLHICSKCYGHIYECHFI